MTPKKDSKKAAKPQSKIDMPKIDTPPVTSLRIPVHTLADAIVWAGHAAGSERDMPALTGINFTIGAGDALAQPFGPDFAFAPAPAHGIQLAATDRYRLAWATFEHDGPLPDKPVSFLLPARPLLALARTWPKPARGAGPFEVLVEWFPGKVTFTVAQLGITEAMLDTMDSTFPKYKGLVTPAPSEMEATMMRVNSRYLAQMSSAAARVGGPGIELFAESTVKPVRVRFDGRYIQASAIIMPLKRP